MRPHPARPLKVLLAASIGSLLIAGAGGVAAAGSASSARPHRTQSLQVSVLLAGSTLHHTFTPAATGVAQTEALTHPDDITRLGGDLFVGFQNGVGPQGEASADGNLDSTIVELTLSGQEVGQWDIVGKCDGLTADPALDGVIATVNEDANSAIDTIVPSAGSDAVTRYNFSEPLAHGGGTDAISIYEGQLLISASAPGTNGAAAPQASYPAVYSVQLDASTRQGVPTPLFYDEDSAIVAGSHPRKTVALALTDPDSNEIVPSRVPRFGRDFMLTSQGDLEQIYVSGAGTPTQQLTVLTLSQSVDDTAWPTAGPGRLFTTDSTNDSIDVVTGTFSGVPIVVATPCGSNSAPEACPAPGFPDNYLATLSETTGQVTEITVSGAAYTPQGGLDFVAGR